MEAVKCVICGKPAKVEKPPNEFVEPWNGAAMCEECGKQEWKCTVTMTFNVPPRPFVIIS